MIYCTRLLYMIIIIIYHLYYQCFNLSILFL